MRAPLLGLLRSASGAFLVLLVPPILIRELGPTTYGAWAIAVEVGTYLGLLDLGALSAIGQFTARHRGEPHGMSRVITTLLTLQLALVAVGGALLALLVAALPSIYPRLPLDLVPGARLTLVLVGGSSLIGLLATTWTGYLLSVGRLVVPSSLTIASRLMGIALVILLAVLGFGLRPLAIAWAGATLAGYLAVGWLFGRQRLPLRAARFDRSIAAELVAFAGAHAPWIAGGLLVVGFDTTIVARLDFAYVAPFAATAGLMSIMTAAYSTALAPLVPISAELAGGGQRADLTRLLVRITRIGGAAVVLSGAVLALFARPLLVAWIGAPTATLAVPILQVLIAATALRLIVMPYAVLVFGTGEYRFMRRAPLVEGVVNVVASIVLGVWFGPIGVAYGTVVGAVAGIGVYLLANVPRTPSIDLHPLAYLRSGLARPLFAALPVTIAVLGEGRWPGSWAWPVAAVSLTATTVACWHFTLTTTERTALLSRLRRPDATEPDPGSGFEPEPVPLAPAGGDRVLEPL
ncbi:MAG TPA: hypothetical protein VGM93_14170 [Acidimicrobiales bacterium]